MSIVPMWVWLVIGLAVAAAGTTAVLAYNHAIANAEALEASNKLLNASITELNDQQAKTAKNLKALSEANDANQARIAAIDAGLTATRRYTDRKYKEATNAERLALDTHLPAFRCVFDGSCSEAGPIVPSKPQ